MNKKLLLIILITTVIIIAGIFLVLQLNSDSGNDDSDDDDDSNLGLPLDLKKGRFLGVDVTMAEGMDYDIAFDIAKSIGIDFITLSFGWDDIETEPYNYTNENLQTANRYYPLKNCKIALVIAPIDTNVDRRPTDLKGKALNDTEVISRCNDMLYNVSTQLIDVDLVSLSIGNEVNAYLGSDQKAWANYTDFFNQTSDYARTLWPNTKIGCKTMLDALIKTHKIETALLNNYSDVIMTTYYPIYDDFTVKPLSVINEDFDNISLTYKTKDIYLLEVGYPSNTTLGSSNSTQAAFIEEIFKQWNLYANRIKLINICWLHDRTKAEVNDFCNYYGIIDNENFKAHLGSLGIRTSYGKEKESYLKLEEMANKNGW